MVINHNNIPQIIVTAQQKLRRDILASPQDRMLLIVSHDSSAAIVPVSFCINNKVVGVTLKRSAPLTQFHRSVCRRAVSRRTLESLERWLWWDFPWTSSEWPWRVPSSRAHRSEVALYGWCCSSPSAPSHHTRPLCLPCVGSGWSRRRGMPPGLDTEALPHARSVSVDVYGNKWTSFSGHYVFMLHLAEDIVFFTKQSITSAADDYKIIIILLFPAIQESVWDW